jgi:hypothetical protein
MRKIDRAFFGKASFCIVMVAFLSQISAISAFGRLSVKTGNAVRNASEESFNGYTIAKEGAWCWFADPRALHSKMRTAASTVPISDT